MDSLFNQELWLVAMLTLLLLGLQPILFSRFVNILRQVGLARLNYKNDRIPTATGLWIMLVHLPFLFLWMGETAYLLQVVAVGVLAWSGWWDDVFGEKGVKGFHGHLGALRKGRWTSGMGKALAGAFTAFVLSMSISGAVWETIVSFLVIALTINLLNLFDLRPGRAWKIFFFSSTILLAVVVPYASLVGPQELEFVFFILLPPFIAASVMFLPDLRGKIMLGDAGANVLGGLLGYWMVLWAPFILQVLWLFIVLVVHAYAEKKSISRLIEATPFLHKIDHWGRT